MTVDHFEVTDRSLTIDDDTAIAAYVFDITYRAGDAEYRELGQEVLVLRKKRATAGAASGERRSNSRPHPHR